MPNKKLILITSSYPYLHGETFLETEINYLAEAFEEIIIIPMQCEGQKRNYPENVNIIDTFANQNRGFFKRLTTIINKPEFYRNLGLSFRYNRFLFTWTYYAYTLKAFLKKQFASNDLNQYLFYSYWCNFVPVALALFREENKAVTFISRAHGSDLYEAVHQMPAFPFREKVLEQTSKLFTISDQGRQHLINRYSQYTQKIEVSKLGTLSKKIKNQASQDKVFRIVTCSNMILLKRIHLLIEALAVLDKKAIRIHWTHIGDGPLGKQLRTQTSISIGNSVSYEFLGRIPNKEVLLFYEKNPVDLFVNISSSEGIPVSIMEIQSMGIPALATDVGGTGEIVNANNGWLVPKNTTSQDLVVLLEEIIAQKDIFSLKRKQSSQDWGFSYDATQNYTAFSRKIATLD